MALKLDNTLLEELGLGALPESEKQLLLRQIYEKLEMNVGMRLADQMSNEQLDAFEKFVDANDDKGAFQWLETNFPNYKQVVNEEFEKLKNEIRSVAPQILASASQQAPGAVPAAAAPGSQADAGMPPQQPAAAPQQQYGSAQQYGWQPGQLGQPGQPQPGQPAPGFAAPQQPYYGVQPGAAVPQDGHLQPNYGQPAAQPPYQGQGHQDGAQNHPQPPQPQPGQ